MIFARMNTRMTFWLIWLLMWHASGSHAQQCSQVAGQQTASNTNAVGCQAAPAAGTTFQQTQPAQPQGTCGAQATVRAVATQPGLATVSLHEYVYKSDFAGFREDIKFLDLKENHPALVGALQSTDDKGLTIAHLLACSGRSDELFLVTQAVHKVQQSLVPAQAKVFMRAALEGLSHNASCTSCRPDRAQHEVVPHLRLDLQHPRQTIFLYGNVTPLECAAAHGHVDAMKLLMQRGVSAGRALIVAQHFGLENQLFEAVARAKAEGGYGVELHPDLPSRLEAPMRKPRQRRPERKSKSKGRASGTSVAGSSKKAATGAAAAAAGTPPPQQQQGNCGAPQPQPPSLKMSPVGVDIGPGGQAASIGSVASSLLAARGQENKDPAKPATTPTQLSEVMDVTALWLLSIMLFFPAWSTACLLWRKMVKRRWALQESVSRVRRCLTKPFRRSSSDAVASSTAGITPAAAAASTGAAAAGSPAQRSGGSGSNDSSKAAASRTAGGSGSGRQQRKVGLSIALPGGSGVEQLGSSKAKTPSGGGLFRTVSAPEHNIKDQLKALARASDEASGDSPRASLPRHSSTVATAVAASAGAGAAAAAAAAATTAAPLPPLARHPRVSALADVTLTRQGSTGKAAAAAAAATSSTAAGSSTLSRRSGASAAGSTGSASATAGLAGAANKQKRLKHAGTPSEASSGGSGGDSSPAAPATAKAGTTASAASSASTGSGTTSKGATKDSKGPKADSSSSSRTSSAPDAEPPKAPRAPQVLIRSSKPVVVGRAISTAAAAAALQSSADSPVDATIELSSPLGSPSSLRKSKSDAAALAAAAAAAGAAESSGHAAGSAAAGAAIGQPAEPTAPAQVKRTSALTAALKPGFKTLSGSSALPELEVHSPNGSSSSRLASTTRLTPRMAGSPAARGDSSAAQPSPLGGRSRTAIPADAAAAREAAEASAAATAALRRTYSGSASIGSRSPSKDMDDVLRHCRDQDRPHGTSPAAAAGPSSSDLASSAPSSNAWTPAAAAARAARAAVHTKPAESESGSPSDNWLGHSSDATPVPAAASTGEDVAEEGAVEVTTAAPTSVARAVDDNSSSSSSSTMRCADCTPAAAAPESGYVDSFTAAAIAAGILPSPKGTADAPADAGAAAGTNTPSPRLQHSGHNRAHAAVKAATSAAVAADPAGGVTSPAKPQPGAQQGANDVSAAVTSSSGASAAAHSPLLDPQVSLLPSGLFSRLGAAPGPTAASAALGRSISAVEPKLLQDLAVLVADSMAEEVAGRSNAQRTSPATNAAADGSGSTDSSPGRAAWSEARSSDPGSKTPGRSDSSSNGASSCLAGMTGSSLLQQPLEVVLAQLTASQGAAASGVGPGPTQQPLALPPQAGPDASAAVKAANMQQYSLTGEPLFRGLEELLNVPQKLALLEAGAPQQQHQQQQQQQQSGPSCSDGLLLSLDGAWVPGGAVSDVAAGPCQLADPPGLMGPHGLPDPCTNLPATAADLYNRQQQLQMPQVSTVPPTMVIGADGALVAAQTMTLLQHPQQQVVAVQNPQPQVVAVQNPQQQLTQQQMQGMVLTLPQTHQPLQVVSMQHVAAGPPAGQAQLIQLSNGQLIHGHLLQLQGHQTQVVSVIAANAPAGHIVIAPGNVVGVQQQVSAGTPQQQPATIMTQQRVFMPQAGVGGGLQGTLMACTPPRQQHVLHVQNPVRVLAAPGHAQGSGRQQGLHRLAVSPGPDMPPLTSRPVQRATPQQSNRPAATSSIRATVLSSSPPVVLGSSPGGGVTVLEAPAGPGGSGTTAAQSEQLQGLLQAPQRHNETGVYVAWPPTSRPAAAVEAPAALAPRRQTSESALMAAELDELLQQANQLVGVSARPAEVKASAPEPSAAATSSPCLAGLEGLQLPDGFTSG